MTVFAVQRHTKRDRDTGEIVNVFGGIEKAERWGELRFILSPDTFPWDIERNIDHIHYVLRDFCDADLLLLIGNPALIGICTSIASSKNEGRLRLLQWSKKHEDYAEIKTNIL